MSFNDLMNKIRQWDNRCAHWMMRHFYLLFFEFVLVIIFFVFLFNTFHTLDISNKVSGNNLTEQLLVQQSTNTHLIILLMLLNSFWMLYIFNGMERLRVTLKEISFNISRRRNS